MPQRSIETSDLRQVWSQVWDQQELAGLEADENCTDEWTLIHKPIVERWVGGLPPGPIMEMGCGLGQWTRFYARHGREAIGVDVVPEATARARQLAENQHLTGASFAVGDARALPFADGTFAGMSSFGVIEHFWDNDLEQMLREAYRVLAPSGQLLVSTPNIWSAHTLTRPVLQLLGKWPLGLERSFSPERLARYVRDAGFSVIEYGVLESGTLFGGILSRRIRLLERLGRLIERRQNTLGFVSYVIGSKA